MKTEIIFPNDYNKLSDGEKCQYKKQWQRWDSGWIDTRECKHIINGHTRLIYKPIKEEKDVPKVDEQEIQINLAGGFKAHIMQEVDLVGFTQNNVNLGFDITFDQFIKIADQLKHHDKPLQAVDANKEVETELKQRFLNKFDCYADTGEVVPAMTFDAVLELFKWQQAQSIDTIVGFVLEWVADRAIDKHVTRSLRNGDNQDILDMKADIIKDYNNGK